MNALCNLRSANIEIEKLLEFRSIELQGRLVFGHACIGDKAIDSTLLGDDGVHRLSDLVLNRHVGLDEVEVWMCGLKREKFVARLLKIKRVDDPCRISQAYFGYAETNATIGTRDC